MSSKPSDEKKLARTLAGVWERQWEEDPLGCRPGDVDRSTRVVWVQTPCGVYVDLRVPINAPGRSPRQSNVEPCPEAIVGGPNAVNTNYTDQQVMDILLQKSFAGLLHCSVGDTTKGRVALKKDSILADLAKKTDGAIPLCTCFWERIIDYQPPTESLDVGVCASSPVNEDGTVDMRETGEDGSYAEGWRRVAGTSEGPFVALQLYSENGMSDCRDGFVVRAGTRFAYAVGRPKLEHFAAKLGCDSRSVKIRRDCINSPLSEVLDCIVGDIATTPDEAVAIASTYVAAVGEIDKKGSWRVTASNLAELVGCTLASEDREEPLCCSVLSTDGDFVDQVIPTRNGDEAVRRWKVLELTGGAKVLPLQDKKL